MSGLNQEKSMHRQSGEADKRSVKQRPKWMHPHLASKIKAWVDKLIKAGFIRELQYPTWLSNIIPAKKKNGNIRIYVDFWNLNKAYPKDAFSIPHTDLLVDATTVYEGLMFMDGFWGYYQIEMHLEDEEITAWATYQRPMVVVIKEMLGNIIDCFVDDLVVTMRQRRIIWNTYMRCSTNSSDTNQRWIHSNALLRLTRQILGFLSQT